MLGRVQYMGLEREYNSNIITGATKYSPSLYSDSIAIRYCRNLSDDFPISKKMELLAIDDFSYVLIENDKSTIYGSAYIIKDGIVTQINENDNILDL